MRSSRSSGTYPNDCEAVSTSPTSVVAVATPSTSWREPFRRAASPASTSLNPPSPRHVPKPRTSVSITRHSGPRTSRNWDFADAFDVITVFDAVHDQVDPARVLANVYRALRPGGTLLMADIEASSRLEENLEIPWAPMSYTISMMHCMTVSLAGGGAGLGSMWGQQRATSMLADAGFEEFEVREVKTDPFNYYYIAFK